MSGVAIIDPCDRPRPEPKAGPVTERHITMYHARTSYISREGRYEHTDGPEPVECWCHYWEAKRPIGGPTGEPLVDTKGATLHIRQICPHKVPPEALAFSFHEGPDPFPGEE